MKKSKFLKKSNKDQISFKRKISVFLKRFFLFVKLSIFTLVCLLIFTDYFKFYTDEIRDKFNHYTARHGFVLENIIIQGQNNTKYTDIIQSLKADKGDPIFSVNIKKVKERLEEATWIKRVVMERRLPSTIYIEIIEREPVAIWQFRQKLYIVDSEGNRITKYSGEGFADLIHLVGIDANIYANNLLSELRAHPSFATKIKSAVRYGNRRWNLNLEQNIVVKMPENSFSDAYNYLHKLYRDKKLFDQNYKMLDLRDPNKYYLEKN